MADPCDVCGGDAKSYGPRGRRCLACLPADEPALRSDVPVLGECDWGPLCVHHASVRRLRARLAFAEIARAEAVRDAEEWGEAASVQMDVSESLGLLCDTRRGRIAEAIRVLETFGDIGGAAALRALRGEGT